MTNDKTMINTSIYLPKKMLDKLMEIAEDDDSSISRIIRLAIKEYIKTYKK